MTAWTCDAHGVTTTGDCPRCDDEQVADLERYARLPVCPGCGRTLRGGESAWATDVKVIEPTGVRMETRYSCDSCESFRPERGAE